MKNKEIEYYSNQLEIKSSNSQTFSIDNITVTDSTAIANGFNNFFVSVGPKLANDIMCTINPMSYVTSIEHSIAITDISCTEVKQVISSLKNSSAGWDELPTFVAKNVLIVILNP